uniref:wall-associated receptor kinase-like 14 n=1 Tax=Erigeron canadensis TaxID=72917 RepID=UPI001CB89097|nr:wall-associated receptor kinase-like 14 [Erigeron canadensis]
MLHEYNILGFFATLIITTTTYIVQASNCTRTCQNNNNLPNNPIIPYPFGFSDSCHIKLNCSQNGEIQIGNYTVINITHDHIKLKFQNNCDRVLKSQMWLLNHTNFALSSRNGLLLEKCINSSLIPCMVSSASNNSNTTITRPSDYRFSIPQCDTNRTENYCFSDENPGYDKFMDLEKLESWNCERFLSSAIVDGNSEGINNNNNGSSLEPNTNSTATVSLELQSLELGWWMIGDCNCDDNAVCVNVSVGNRRVGYRCRCNDGFAGDGFVAGDGCRKAKKCGASRYMSGECGGTTRVGVLIGGIVAGVSLMSTVALVCYCLRKRAALKNQRSARRQFSEATSSFNVPFYHYKEIERATNSFSEKQRLGVGAYGTVYAGKLNSNEWVAVKKIRHRDTDVNGDDQVMNEIKLISTVNHPHLVRLLGCCIEKGEQILVYEFMPNGTLSQHLQKERGKGLPWTVRLTIATETAHAIAHLHSANPPIYHRDIKSSNILLDYNYNSKVADFGLSRLGMLDDSHISTAPQGTPGYVDPQYHQNFHLSDKSDVYSFGVVLVEIITALKVVDFSRNHTEINLAALAIDKIGKGCVDEIIDPYLEPNRDAWTLSSIHKVAELAFRCLAFHRDMRPSMTEVADELEQIKLSGWSIVDDDVTMASSVASVSSSPYNGSEKSFGGTIVKKVIGSRRLGVPQVIPDCLKKTEEEKDSSPVSVQDQWLSGQSSPSSNSLLGNVARSK